MDPFHFVFSSGKLGDNILSKQKHKGKLIYSKKCLDLFQT